MALQRVRGLPRAEPERLGNGMFGLDGFLSIFGAGALVGAGVALGLGGMVKGVVGFALPLVSLSVMASFLPVETAVGLLILPTLVANLLQSTRNGMGAAWGSLRRYAFLNAVLMATILVSAQLLVLLPEQLLFALLGLMVGGLGTVQLLGWRPTFPPARRRLAELATGVVAGFFGGFSGSWGPPLVLYLLAAGVPKPEMVRVQSVSYLLGSVVLLGAHLRSGVLNALTLPVSAWLALPAMAGMLVGYRLQDRLDQELFRRVTLLVLILAGLNLLRRGLTG